MIETDKQEILNNMVRLQPGIKFTDKEIAEFSQKEKLPLYFLLKFTTSSSAIQDFIKPYYERILKHDCADDIIYHLLCYNLIPHSNLNQFTKYQSDVFDLAKKSDASLNQIITPNTTLNNFFKIKIEHWFSFLQTDYIAKASEHLNKIDPKKTISIN